MDGHTAKEIDNYTPFENHFVFFLWREVPFSCFQILMNIQVSSKPVVKDC